MAVSPHSKGVCVAFLVGQLFLVCPNGSSALSVSCLGVFERLNVILSVYIHRC